MKIRLAFFQATPANFRYIQIIEKSICVYYARREKKKKGRTRRSKIASIIWTIFLKVNDQEDCSDWGAPAENRFDSWNVDSRVYNSAVMLTTSYTARAQQDAHLVTTLNTKLCPCPK